MKYNLFDKEIEVFDEIIDFQLNDIYYKENDELDLFNKMKDSAYWNDNTKESPDIISEKYKTMIECMQVNDYTKNGNDNKYAKDKNEINKEIKKVFNVKEKFPNLSNIFIDSKVPTKYCSINNYRQTCHRVIEKHIDNIQKYKSEHKDFKLVFLIIDLTETTYWMKLDQNSTSQAMMPFHPIFDEDIMSIFLDKDIDYILWYRPYQQQSIINPLSIINNRKFNSFVKGIQRNNRKILL